MDLIFYHANCPDGWAAAYIAKMKYPEATLRPAEFSTPPPFAEVEGKDVLMVDFAWKGRDINLRLYSLAKSLLILDHHKTNLADLANLSFAIFDMSRSGAGLAWDYLFGKDSGNTCNICDHNEPDGHRPWWVNYIEDRDLWNNALPNTREINAYLMSLPHTLEAWDTLSHPVFNKGRAIDLGQGALSHINHYVREVLKMRKLGIFEGYSVGVLNIPYLNCSEVGHELAKESQIGLCYYERHDEKICFSMRSIGDIDVSVIAKKFGGGGHRNAAGFERGIAEGRELIDKILGRDPNGLRLERLRQETELQTQIQSTKAELEQRRPGGCIK
jgi:hypothetical protein